MSDKILLLDLDGVIVDFVEGVCRLFGQDVASLYERWPPGEGYAFWRLFDKPITDSDFWGEVHHVGDAFWESLIAYPRADALLGRCHDYADHVYFASAGNPRRLTWLERWLGKKTSHYAFAEHKHLLAAPGRLLIDDHDEQVDAFLVAGGDVILYPQPWNRRHAEAGPDAAFKVMQEIAAWSGKR